MGAHVKGKELETRTSLGWYRASSRDSFHNRSTVEKGTIWTREQMKGALPRLSHNDKHIINEKPRAAHGCPPEGAIMTTSCRVQEYTR